MKQTVLELSVSISLQNYPKKTGFFKEQGFITKIHRETLTKTWLKKQACYFPKLFAIDMIPLIEFQLWLARLWAVKPTRIPRRTFLQAASRGATQPPTQRPTKKKSPSDLRRDRQRCRQKLGASVNAPGSPGASVKVQIIF